MRIAALPPLLQQALLATLAGQEDGFAVATSGADRQAAPTLPAAVPPASQPATSVQMLVALAAAEPATERRRKQAAVADRCLSALERLHAELAIGMATRERLRELVDWSQSLDPPVDPHLATLQREIEVRVRVEIAKLDRQL